jgi:hypothetical protein
VHGPAGEVAVPCPGEPLLEPSGDLTLSVEVGGRHHGSSLCLGRTLTPGEEGRARGRAAGRSLWQVT